MSTSIPELERERRKMHETFSKADAAHHAGKITKEQRDTVLHHYYGTHDEQEAMRRFEEAQASYKEELAEGSLRTYALMAGFVVIMMSLFGVLFFTTGGLSGAVLLDQIITNDTMFPIALNGTTAINVTGTIEGMADVTITLRHAGTDYRLYESLRAPAASAHAALTRRAYLLGENVTYAITDPTGVGSVYLMTADAAVLLAETTLTGLAPGDYAIKLLVTDVDGNATQEILPFSVVETLSPETITFNDCGEACNVDLTGDAELVITMRGGRLLLDQAILGTAANQAPLFIADIPDQTGETVAIDMAAHFTDPEDDLLVYASSSHDDTIEAIDGSVLTITGAPGTYTYTVYASDGRELTMSNIFGVTITAPETEMNESTNGTLETNTTVENATAGIVATNETNIENSTRALSNVTNSTFDLGVCEGLSPGMLPLECLQADAERYFTDSEKQWENPNREPVAKFNALGNMLITGDVIEYSIGGPSGDEFSLGTLVDDEPYATIWIDGDGNLHLRGALHEELVTLTPPAGSYTIITKRSVYIAYADISTGDLYLRGNLIPYRRSLG